MPDRKPHAVLEDSWKWEIVALDYQRNGTNSSLMLTFKKGDQIRKLRFADPQQLVIEENFTNPGNPSFVYIEDIRDRHWEGLGVHVGHFEQTGVLRFYAKDVEVMGADVILQPTS